MRLILKDSLEILRKRSLFILFHGDNSVIIMFKIFVFYIFNIVFISINIPLS